MPRPARGTLQRSLLAWYRRHRRDLPWRRTRDPWAIWVSEIMLQQTRVEVVRPRFVEFLDRFPSARDLAGARESDVLALWSGLGYYSRARNLHRAAQEIVERHGGAVPAETSDLIRLPGIGRYTAGAIASIAFGRPAPVVDGNVARVLARRHAIRDPLRTPRAERRLWSLAAALVPAKHAGEWNQALMELGATVCMPKQPTCGRCPLRRGCVAFARGIAHQLPVVRPRPKAVRVRHAVAVVRRNGRYLLSRNRGTRLLGGLWQFPTTVVADDDDPIGALRGKLVVSGIRARDVRPVETIRHVIMNRRIESAVFEVQAVSARSPRGEEADLAWLTPAEIEGMPLCAVGKKIARRLPVLTTADSRYSSVSDGATGDRSHLRPERSVGRMQSARPRVP